MNLVATILILVAVVCGLAFFARWWRRRRAAQRYERALATLPERADLESMFLAAAAMTGKPRGLRWKRCQVQGEPTFATDYNTGAVYALLGATIEFEAIPGGDMEDVEAVSDIRYATTVFLYTDDGWTADGRAIFNLEPAQALSRLNDRSDPIG